MLAHVQRRLSTHCVPLHMQTSAAHLSMGETTEHAASALQERLSSSDGANSSAAAQEPSTAASQLVCARTGSRKWVFAQTLQLWGPKQDMSRGMCLAVSLM